MILAYFKYPPPASLCDLVKSQKSPSGQPITCLRNAGHSDQTAEVPSKVLQISVSNKEPHMVETVNKTADCLLPLTCKLSTPYPGTWSLKLLLSTQGTMC